jgi:hypothetical protein
MVHWSFQSSSEEVFVVRISLDVRPSTFLEPIRMYLFCLVPIHDPRVKRGSKEPPSTAPHMDGRHKYNAAWCPIGINNDTS